MIINNFIPQFVARKPRAPKGPKLPDPFTNGTILQDLRKKQWKLGNEVGKGGFGLIYLGRQTFV